MAFEISKSGYEQIDPTFLPGYEYPNKYHNVGQLMTPYQGKKMSVLGDYAPPQATKYYSNNNRNYPYVLDRNFRASSYLPTEGCCFGHPGYCPCYEGQYPGKYIPSNYFNPKRRREFGHAKPINEFGTRLYSGMLKAYDPDIFPTVEKENYEKMRVANDSYHNYKNYYPFNKKY